MSRACRREPRRANGRASRRQILDAAAEIASECGYQGTSISAVSKRSGLPKSSIYWHFENKEDLFVAVINDSYERWREELAASRASADGDDGHSFENLYANLGRFPDFIRLGLIMTLERVPDGRPRRSSALPRDPTGIAREPPHRAPARLPRPRPSRRPSALAAMTLSQLDGSFVAAMAGETALTPKVLSSAVHTLAKSMIAGDTKPTR